MTSSDDTKLIPLTQGKFASVDATDYEWLMQWKWHYHNAGYAVRRPPEGPIYMHRLISNAADNMEIDHINGNRLDNRRSNLRICTTAQNRKNQKKTRGASKYKGVYWDKKNEKWAASICSEDMRYFLGRFDSEEDAARAYNKAASNYHGNFANLNKVI